MSQTDERHGEEYDDGGIHECGSCGCEVDYEDREPTGYCWPCEVDLHKQKCAKLTEQLQRAKEEIKTCEAALDQHIAERQRVQERLTQTEQWLRESQAELGGGRWAALTRLANRTYRCEIIGDFAGWEINAIDELGAEYKLGSGPTLDAALDDAVRQPREGYDAEGE